MADQPSNKTTTDIGGAIQQATATPVEPMRLNPRSPDIASEVGARVIMDYTDRHEPAFGMIEIEIDALAMLNTTTTSLLSLGTGIIGFAISRFADLSCMASEQKGGAYTTAISSLTIGVGLIIVAGIFATKKSTMKNKLLRKARARFQNASGPDPLEGFAWWKKWIIMRLAPHILDNPPSKAL